MKTAKHIIGSIIGTLGLMGVFICGGGKTLGDVLAVGAFGLALVLLSVMMLRDVVDEEEDGEEER